MEKLQDIDPAEITSLEDNYKIINENINKAMLDAGRSDKVKLMAVTKTVPAYKVNKAISLGADVLGENRVQELLSKYSDYEKNSEIHFIGGLQNNKVKYIIDKVSMIHSVNSLKLAEEISKRSVKAGITMNILLEVNIGEEESKSGVMPDMLNELTAQITELPNINIHGLMAIPPVDINGSNDVYFAKMQRLYHDMQDGFKGRLPIDTLSMGMSNDYERAIHFDSTIVRIGTSLFGYRNYNIGGNL